MSETEKGFVVDTNARPGESRAHEVIIREVTGQDPITKIYRLNSETPTEMPLDHAMKFLRDKAFLVTTSGGEVIKPVVKRDQADVTFQLGENELIAEYSELSREALWKRVKMLPGSESIGKASGNETLIAFIKEKTRRDVGVARGSEGVIGQDDVSDFMEDSPLVKKAA
ncbi:MAG: hypothetical protein EG825_00400 [Rhodocyclaceae bacterium]|nr:hypothetical protein [Rhodocyclaceae bacterium]